VLNNCLFCSCISGENTIRNRSSTSNSISFGTFRWEKYDYRVASFSRERVRLCIFVLSSVFGSIFGCFSTVIVRLVESRIWPPLKRHLKIHFSKPKKRLLFRTPILTVTSSLAPFLSSTSPLFRYYSPLQKMKYPISPTFKEKQNSYKFIASIMLRLLYHLDFK